MRISRKMVETGGAVWLVLKVNYQRSLGPVWSMSEVGTPPPHSLDKPYRLVAIINNNNNLPSTY